MRIFNIKPYSIVLAFILLFALVLLFSSSPVSGDLQSAQGSGNTGMEGRVDGTATAEVQAESGGRGNGRVYHIGFTAHNTNGASCSSEVLVSVPHNKAAQPSMREHCSTPRQDK